MTDHSQSSEAVQGQAANSVALDLNEDRGTVGGWISGTTVNARGQVRPTTYKNRKLERVIPQALAVTMEVEENSGTNYLDDDLQGVHLAESVVIEDNLRMALECSEATFSHDDLLGVSPCNTSAFKDGCDAGSSSSHHRELDSSQKDSQGSTSQEKSTWDEFMASNTWDDIIDNLADDDLPCFDDSKWNDLPEDTNEEDNFDSDGELDNEDRSTTENAKESQKIYRDHWMTVECSLVLILVFALAHSLSGKQLADLLSLINMHLLDSHPAYQSLFRFKKYFANLKSPLKKHHYCNACFHPIDSHTATCPNQHCGSSLNRSGGKGYFIEIPIKHQLQSMFARQGFYENLQHRFKRGKKHRNNIEDVYDGKLYKDMFENRGPLSDPNNISFTWNTDGIPVFKSSKFQLWPIFLIINELEFDLRTRKENMVFAGLWFGESKPCFPTYTKPILSSLQDLEEEGIQIKVGEKDICVKGFLLYGSADLPAKSSVLNMIQFNGKSSCIKCVQPGVTTKTKKGGNVHTFPYVQENPDGDARTESQCLKDAQEAVQTKKTVNGMKGPSFLMGLRSYDFVRGITVDYMHCILLGITKLLISLWFSPCHSGEMFSFLTFIELVDQRLLKIKPTHNISRVPRSLANHLKYWKASELRSWLLFYSIPILSDILSQQYFYHYSAFVEGVHILSKDSISMEEIEKSRSLFHFFVYMFEPLYGARYCTLNIHSLLHISDCVIDQGPLWALSCFPFENMNGEIMKLFHGTQSVDIQIVSAVNIIHKLPHLMSSISGDSQASDLMRKLRKMKLCKQMYHISHNIVALGKLSNEN